MTPISALFRVYHNAVVCFVEISQVLRLPVAELSVTILSERPCAFCPNDTVISTCQVSENPLPNVVAVPEESNLFVWHANVRADEDSALTSATFHLTIHFPEVYPSQPPEVSQLILATSYFL